MNQIKTEAFEMRYHTYTELDSFLTIKIIPSEAGTCGRILFCFDNDTREIAMTDKQMKTLIESLEQIRKEEINLN